MNNEINQKILLLLDAGVDFTFAYHPGKKWKAVKNLSREWRKINRNNLEKSIRSLYKLDIINKIENVNGLIDLGLTEKGKLRVLNYKLESIKNKNNKWDKKWRMVAFDIPEKAKRGRDALRRKLNKIGFKELQKSVFITSYDCEKEIGMLVKFFNLEKYVRFGLLEFIDNESYFKKVFHLN